MAKPFISNTACVARILRILNRFNLGGPTYNAAYLTKHLAPEFETMLIGGMKDESEGSSEFILQKMDVPYTVIPEMKRKVSLTDDWKALRKIRKIIRNFKPDIVHTHASKAGTLGRLAAIFERVPVIVHTFHGHVFHGYFNRAQSIFFRNIEWWLAARTSSIIALSRLQKDELVNQYRICTEEKVHVIPLGFDLSRFRENQEEKRSAFRKEFLLDEETVAIGIIGRIVPVKNHRMFVDAVRVVQSSASMPVKVFIIGDGELKSEVLKYAQLQGLTVSAVPDVVPGSNVIFTSWVKDIDSAIAGMDLIVLTSWNEGTPVSIIEAQAAGKPVVSVNVGGIEDVVLPGISALVSVPGDAVSLAKNISILLPDKEKRRALGMAGQEHVMQRFDYQRLVRETASLYRSLLLKP